MNSQKRMNMTGLTLSEDIVQKVCRTLQSRQNSRMQTAVRLCPKWLNCLSFSFFRFSSHPSAAPVQQLMEHNQQSNTVN
jgi:hypothetical protein